MKKQPIKKNAFGIKTKYFYSFIVFAVLLIICLVLLIHFLFQSDSRNNADRVPVMIDYIEDTDSLYEADLSVSPIPSSGDVQNISTEFKQQWLSSHPPVKGIYVSGVMAGTNDLMNNLITLVDRTDLNTMVIDVKNDEGNISFSIDNQVALEIGSESNYIKDINKLMSTLKEHNIYTIARIVCFKDPKLAEGHPELALKTTTGDYVCGGDGMAWVNPYKEEVWEYITDIAIAASDIGFDEVQFDYVRFPIIENADYGIDEANYNKQTAITNFLTYASAKLHEHNIVLGVDLFGTVIISETDKSNVGQDYATLAQLVDVLSPMVYPSHYGTGSYGYTVPDAHPYEIVSCAMESSKQALSTIEENKRALVRPWLQSFTATWIQGHISYSEEQISEQISAINDAGYSEWILWNAKNRYDYSNVDN